MVSDLHVLCSKINLEDVLLKESALDTLLALDRDLPPLLGLRRVLTAVAVAAKKLPLSFSNVLLQEDGLSNVLPLLLVLKRNHTISI